MTRCGIGDIIGHEGNPQIKSWGAICYRICPDFGVEMTIFNGEKAVEITLKSLPILLTKRSKNSTFRALSIDPAGCTFQRSLTVVQSFRSMKGPLTPA
jgi:hypothetical protein